MAQEAVSLRPGPPHLAAALGVGQESARMILNASRDADQGREPSTREIEHAERVLQGVAALVWTFPVPLALQPYTDA